MEQFLGEYKDYVEQVLSPTRKEIKKLFGDWRDADYWGTYSEGGRSPTPSPVQRVVTRIKRPESVVDKIWRKPEGFPEGLAPSSFRAMTDAVAARVIVYFISNLPLIDHEIQKSGFLEIAEKDPPKAYMNGDLAGRLALGHLSPTVRESGYVSLHYILRLKNSAVPVADRPWFELQVRTITEDAWGEIEHLLGYKPGKSTSFAVRRQFQIISKLLEAVDEHFSLLQEELSRFQERVESDSSAPLNAENLPGVLVELGLGCAQKEIDGLLKLLVSRGVKDVGSLRGLGDVRHLQIVKNKYYAKKSRPPNNFELVANLANLIGCKEDAELSARIDAQMAFLDVWAELKEKKLV
jgi:putative GTP pyrophosphokinase